MQKLYLESLMNLGITGKIMILDLSKMIGKAQR